MNGEVHIRRLESIGEREIEQLACVLHDCVSGGASIGFVEPFTREQAAEFWRKVRDAVSAGRRVIVVAEDAEGICGTAQLVLQMPDNQPHRADVVKVLVHRRARKRGVGAALMRRLESLALEHGRDMLVLDAVTGGDASRMYERAGWVRAGDIPRYAMYPDGSYCSTTYYYKDLRPGARLG